MKTQQDCHKADQKDLLAVNLGLTANILLAISKLTIGILAKSQALISDGINSASDTVYYLITKIYAKRSSKPADKKHPYGHRQLENITSVIVGTFILLTAILLFSASLNQAWQLFANDKPIAENPYFKISIAIATLTVLTKLFLWIFTKSAYQKSQNSIIKALASDHLNDVLTAIAVIIGITAAHYGHSWADPLAGSLVAMFIFYTGYETIKDSTDGILTTVPSPELQTIIMQCTEQIPEILCADTMRVHYFGQKYTLIMTICLDGKLTVEKGDKIADKLEILLHQNMPKLIAVNIHYHPKYS